MLLNNLSIVDRHNRPPVTARVGLQAHFIVDGQYSDPYEISAVTIFPKSVNFYPSSLLASSTELIDVKNVSGSILMNFSNPSALTANFSGTNDYYTGSDYIFRIDTGKYIVVLDGILGGAQFGTINLNDANLLIYNSASATGDYVDVWTITMFQGSEPQTIINDFTLRKGGFTVLTEPLMLKAKSRLVNNKVTLGSKIDLKIATDIHVENTDVDESIKNLFRENIITGGQIEIQKLNDAANLPARVTVSSFSDTSSLVDITGDNVLVFNWDTSELSTHPELMAGNFGSIQGVYAIRSKFSMVNEVIISDPMYLTIS